ncbi:MAG: hypothetical protein ACO1OB_13030 [Archangium sp.]
MTEVHPGIWVVRFIAGKITAPECEHLLPPLLAASKIAPIILIASLPPGTTMIPAGLAPFWLNAMLLKGLRVRDIGVVTTSRAVRTVVSGFQAAMKLRSQPLGAETRATEEEIVAWAKAQVVRTPT